MNNKREAGRGTIYMMAGLYICITAWNMFKNRAESTGNEAILVLVCSVLFAVLGVGLMIIGGYMVYKGSRKK